MKNTTKNNTATLLPAIIVSADGTKAELKRNPNDLIIMNAQTDLCGRKLALIPVSEIDVNMSYQRTQTKQAVNKLVANWDSDLYEPIRVIYRDGKFRAWDGGKRLAAQIIMGKTEVVCQICNTKTMDADMLWHEEIKRFKSQTECITKLRPVDMFRANLADGEPLETMIKSVCDEFGVTLKLDGERGWKQNKTITNISRFTSLAKTIKEDGIRWIFSLIHDMKMDREGYNGYNTAFIMALGFLYNDPVASHSVMAKRLIEYHLAKPEVTVQHKTFSWRSDDYKYNARKAYPNCSDEQALVNFFEDIILGLVKN